MTLSIKCFNCHESIMISDGYNNEQPITLRIVGEQIIEIKCITCNEILTVIDGNV